MAQLTFPGVSAYDDAGLPKKLQGYRREIDGMKDARCLRSAIGEPLALDRVAIN